MSVPVCVYLVQCASCAPETNLLKIGAILSIHLVIPIPDDHGVRTLRDKDPWSHPADVVVKHPWLCAHLVAIHGTHYVEAGSHRAEHVLPAPIQGLVVEILDDGGTPWVWGARE